MRNAGFIIILLLLTVPCAARVITVDDDNPADFATIQEAINAAFYGDTVTVSPGTYYENINFNGKNIRVRSTHPDHPNIVESTIINANGVGSVVTFANNEGRDSVLEGFTLTGGIGTEYMADRYAGGGIYCIEAAPSILQNIITGNGVNESGSGGGLFCDVWSNPLLYKNIIMNNSAKYGGAVYLCYVSSQIELCSNVICHNTARLRGGGLYLRGKAVLVNNMVYGNETAYFEGGGIYMEGVDSSTDNSIITENTIVDNYSKQSGANLHIQSSKNVTLTNNIIVNALNGAGVYLYESSVVFRYNNVWNNEGGNYAGTSDMTAVEGNISVEPVFVSPQSDNYHLQSSSPCINAGDPAFIPDLGQTDIDGEPLVMGGRIDIGADEYLLNIKPVADAGDGQTYRSIPSLVTLDGSDSYDYNNDSLTCQWHQIDGPMVVLNDPCAVGPAFVPAELGIYVFELVVNDGRLESDPDVVGIVIGNNHAPVADAGTRRYPGTNPVVLDGTGSYDPDGFGELAYQWQQVSGPAVVIKNADTATPTISGFSQTSSIQECEIQLVVSDGDLASEPDTVKIMIVASFGSFDLVLSNPPFDLDKPTILAFGGGYDCGHGVKYQFSYKTSFWYQKANIMTMAGDWYSNRYQDYGDMLIVFLSSEAPDYKQPIQTIGYSAGNGPAIDVANYVNLTYADARYAVNRVTLLDAACGDYPARVSTFLSSSVGGEPCLVDNYMATHGPFCPGALNVRFPTVPPDRPWDQWWGVYHAVPRRWYEKSSDPAEWVNGDIFNGGITAGAYVSVIGPAKNLRLGPDSSTYYFEWSGEEPDDGSDGVPDTLLFFDESSYPGKLPEPVTLIGPEDGAVVDTNGAVLSCHESENAVGYQLLFGPDPYRMVLLISDTPSPPNDIITAFPFEKTWWTVKAYDQYGTTIHADPICINAENVTATPTVQNLTTGKKYPCIQQAINDSKAGDQIVVSPGIWEYTENIDFKGENITLRSKNPNDPAVVAATIIKGNSRQPVVTFSSGQSKGCILSGLTLTNGDCGIYSDSSDPTISDCVVTGNATAGIHCLSEDPLSDYPTITNCLIVGNRGDGVYIHESRPVIANCTIAQNAGAGIYRYYCRLTMPVTNSIIWGNSNQQIDGQHAPRPATVTYSDVQGSWPGLGNIDDDPYFVDAANGHYHLQSQAGRWNPTTQTWVKDAVTSPCIDAGDPNSDWSPELWPHGKWINMGAYGGTPQAGMSLSPIGNKADLNNDDAVNFRDFGYFADRWDSRDVLLRQDLNRNGWVNVIDLAIFADNWLWRQ